jgi:hypothetical protein
LRRHGKRLLWSFTVSASSTWSVPSSFGCTRAISAHSTGVRDFSAIASTYAAVIARGDGIINAWAINWPRNIGMPAAVNASASTTVTYNDMSTGAPHTSGVRRRTIVDPAHASGVCASAPARIPSIGQSPTARSSTGHSVGPRSLTAGTNARPNVAACATRADAAGSIRLVGAHSLSAATNRRDG